MNVTRVLGLAAVGALLILAAPTQRAEALTLSSPAAATTAIQDGSNQMTTEVRWRRGGGWRRHRCWRCRW